MENDNAELVTMTAADFDARIHAANDRMAAETETLHEQNKHLHDLVVRYRTYATRLETTLAELQAERVKMDADVRRLLSPEEQAALKLLTTH